MKLVINKSGIVLWIAAIASIAYFEAFHGEPFFNRCIPFALLMTGTMIARRYHLQEQRELVLEKKAPSN